MTEVTTTLVVEFGELVEESLDGILVAEFDDREDGLNGGDTSFEPGDSIGFLVYKNNKISLLNTFTSTGNVGIVEVGSRQIIDIINFANTDTATLSKPATGGIVAEWMGHDRGPVDLTDQSNLTLLNGVNTGVLQVTYQAAYTGYRVTGIPSLILGKPEFRVLIAIVGTLVE